MKSRTGFRQMLQRCLEAGGTASSRRALWLAALLIAPNTAALAAQQDDLARAMREQQTLLEAAGNDPALGDAEPFEDPEDSRANPRIAPHPPIPRDLPVAIFDEDKIIVPKGEWGTNQRMTVLRRVLDADGDGKPEVQRFIDPRSNLMIRQVEDRNYDGVQDTWSDFEWGAVRSRVLDTNDDGNPDTWESYADGRMTRREVDRDDDGIRDAFYFYEGDSLSKEQHDVNNDGKIDQVVFFQARRRIKAEEDQDRDGRMDRWVVFTTDSTLELPARLELDTKGSGTPDTFEHFEITAGQAVLIRREEDLNGDGQINIVSLYQQGKLVRREIADPALLPGA